MSEIRIARTVDFLDYQIRNTGNGDGWVLFKHGTDAELWECHLGNFGDVETAMKYAVWNFMVARPADFHAHIVHWLSGCGTWGEYRVLERVLEREGIAMPLEISHTEDVNCLITFNGERMYTRMEK